MVKFIAEVSSNHSKDLDRALEFIDVAAEMGCDGVKFQLFKIDQLFSSEILKKSREHRKRKAWELPLDFIPFLHKRCKKHNLKFGCSPFYLDAVDELYSYVDFYKIASYELLWDELLAECASKNKQVIISTGMADTSEIQHAVSVLKENGCKNPIVLHCSSAYPTPPSEANLSAIETLRDLTGCSVGWSDHTHDEGVIFRSVHKWGAEMIEFHFDLDSTGEEFNSGHCWLPEEMSILIKTVRAGFDADGSGIKEPMESERPDRMWRTDPKDGLRPMMSIRKNFKI